MKLPSALTKLERLLRVRGLSLLLMTAAFALDGDVVFAQAQQTGVSPAEQASRQAEAVRSQQQLQKQAQDERAKKASSEDEPPETYPGENDDLGPQKLLKKKKRKQLFEFSSDTMLTWTSNALSNHNLPKEEPVWAQTMTVAFAPQPLDIGIGKLGIRGGYRHLFYVYNVLEDSTVNKNNFEKGTAFVSANLSFLDHWNASLGMDHSRIMKISSNHTKWSRDSIFSSSRWQDELVDWSPNWSLVRSISLAEKLSMVLMYGGAYHFTEGDPLPGLNTVNSLDKLDTSFISSLMWALSDKWQVQYSLRFTHALYTQPVSDHVHRRDVSFAPGMSVMWNPKPTVSFRVSVGEEFRNSNSPTPMDYKKFDCSVGGVLTFKF